VSKIFSVESKSSKGFEEVDFVLKWSAFGAQNTCSLQAHSMHYKREPVAPLCHHTLALELQLCCDDST